MDAEPNPHFNAPKSDAVEPADPTVLDDWVHAMKTEETRSVTPAPVATEIPVATPAPATDLSFLDEWVRDMESVEKELKEKEVATKAD